MEPSRRGMHSKSGQHYSDMNDTVERVVEENTSIIEGLMVEPLKSRKDSDVITLGDCTVADYGTEDGAKILPLMITPVECVRHSKGPNQVISILFEDQCINDFNALLKNVLGNHHLERLQPSDNLHVMVSPTSMYQQCLPRASLDCGFYIYAIHWLSESNWKLKDQIFVYPDNATLYNALTEQARKDWREFVIKRGKELKSGGIFFVSAGLRGSSHKIDYLTEIYREMVRENVISEDELENTNVQFFLGRNEEDFTSIFADANDPEVKNLGLHLVFSKLHDREHWPITKENCSDAHYLSTRARGIMMLIKSWLCNTIFCRLSKERPPAERTAITEEYFDRLRMKILNDGPNFRYNHPMVDFIFQKQNMS